MFYYSYRPMRSISLQSPTPGYQDYSFQSDELWNRIDQIYNPYPGFQDYFTPLLSTFKHYSAKETLFGAFFNQLPSIFYFYSVKQLFSFYFYFYDSFPGFVGFSGTRILALFKYLMLIFLSLFFQFFAQVNGFLSIKIYTFLILLRGRNLAVSLIQLFDKLRYSKFCNGIRQLRVPCRLLYDKSKSFSPWNTGKFQSFLKSHLDRISIFKRLYFSKASFRGGRMKRKVMLLTTMVQVVRLGYCLLRSSSTTVKFDIINEIKLQMVYSRIIAYISKNNDLLINSYQYISHPLSFFPLTSFSCTMAQGCIYAISAYLAAFFAKTCIIYCIL